jgi:hypothetical protein
MGKSSTMPILLLSLLIIVTMVFPSSSFDSRLLLLKQAAYGHNFTSNESASFLSFVDKVQVESELVLTSLANNNTALAQEHATRAMELLKTKDPVNNVTWTEEIAEENQRIADDLAMAVDNLEKATMSSSSLPQQQQQMSTDINQLVNDIDAILGEAVTSRIDEEQRDNATIRALAFAEVINSILTDYGKAYAVGFDMTNMSNMAMPMTDHNSNSSSMAMNGMSSSSSSSSNMDSMNMSSMTMMDSGDKNKNYTLVNMADYQSAQALAMKAQEIFKDELKSMAPSNATNFIAKLEDGLATLNGAIESRAPPMHMMTIVHTQVHPNLMGAFDLELQ